jgi:hypothetical protein
MKQMKPNQFKHKHPPAPLDDPLEKYAPSRSQVPAGYVFIPKGDVYMTRHCRSRTLDAGKTLYVVFLEHKLSRVGLRCPKDIAHSVAVDAEASAQTRQKAVLAKDKRDIDAARLVLGRLFPRIPLPVAEKILLHGFEKGSGRVGRNGQMEADEKVELAVVAHARHEFTGYEKLLKEYEGFGREKAKERAREEIRGELNEILTAWRSVAAVPRKTSDVKFRKSPGHSKNKSKVSKSKGFQTQNPNRVEKRSDNPKKAPIKERIIASESYLGTPKRKAAIAARSLIRQTSMND